MKLLASFNYEIQNQASYSKYLYSIFQKFEKEIALEKSKLIKFFEKNLKPLINAQI